MAKSIKSIALVCAVLIAFGVIYESSLRKITDGGKEWLRRHTTNFCEPGYRLHSEHCWACDNGETYFVYVFETTPMHRGLDPGVQVLLEDINHEPLHRFNVKSEHKLLNTALLQSVTPTRLEVVFRVDKPAPDLYCYYWKVEGNRLLRADFMTIQQGVRKSQLIPRIQPNVASNLYRRKLLVVSANSFYCLSSMALRMARNHGFPSALSPTCQPLF